MPTTPAPDGAAAVERVLALKSVPAFFDSHANELAALAKRARPVEHPAGAVLAGHHTALAATHVLLEGEIEEWRAGRHFRTVAAPSLVAVVDGLARRQSGVSLRARTAVRALAIAQADFDALVDDHFGILVPVMGEVAREWIAACRMVGPGLAVSIREATTPSPDAGADLGSRIAWVRRLGLFRHLSVRTIGQLVLESEERAQRDGETLWRLGDDADHVALVAAGAVACTTNDAGTRFLWPRGSLLGLEDCVAGQARWQHAVAVGEVRVLRVPSATLLDLIEDDMEVLGRTMARIARHVVHALDRVARQRGGASV